MPTRRGHDSIGVSQVTGFGYYFAGNRQGDGNTHISMLNEAGPYDWAPTRRKSPLYQRFPFITDMVTYSRDQVSAKQATHTSTLHILHMDDDKQMS